MYTEMFKLHSDLLKAMSHPKRLEVVHLLRNQEMSVSDIQSMLDLPQANLSQHLMILRSAGVVRTRKSGKQIFYSLSHKNFIEASDLLRKFLIEKHKDSNISDDFLINMTELVPLVHDPVCKMRLSPKTAGYSLNHEGKHIYFCASGCLKKFKNNPKNYED